MTFKSRKLVREVFERQFIRHFPSYAAATEVVLPTGGWAYRRKLSSGLEAFVVLAAWLDDTKITVECATSVDRQLPRLLETDELEQKLKTGVRFRLGRLVKRDDMWWRIAPAVANVLEMTDEEVARGVFPKAVEASMADIESAVGEIIALLVERWQPLLDAFDRE